jgi:uncharacterized phiE125 gp8 family phage protein
MAKHYVGEIGTDIILDCGQDISDATVSDIYYTKPSGKTGHWTGSVYLTNYVKYTTTAAGDLDEAGVWQLQAKLTSPSWTGYGAMTEQLIYGLYDAIAGEIATVTKVKGFLDIKNETDDILIYRILMRMNDRIETYCGRTFASASYTEYHKGDGTNRLLMNQYPITAITSINEDEDRVWGSDTLIDSADYVIADEVPGVIELKDNFFMASDVENIKVVYVAGYATIPNDLVDACIKMTAADYLESKGLAAGMEEGDRNPDKLRKDAYKTLDLYKRIR